MTSYTVRDAARIVGIPAERLRYWERIALVQPSVRVASRREFGFRDLVCIKRIRGLLEKGVPLRQIRQSLAGIEQHMPDLERPLGALRVWLEGSSRVVVSHQGSLVEATGQIVLDFDRPEMQTAAPIAGTADEKGSRDPDAALEWFECALEVDSDPRTRPQAIEFYRRSIEADPSFADAHCNLGAVYANQGRHELARACYERALDESPDHVEANFNLATLLEGEGRNQAALHHYKAAARLDPLHSGTQLSVALLYESLMAGEPTWPESEKSPEESP